jgi:hypothetical protein
MAFLGHHIGAFMLTLSWLAAWAMAASLAPQMSDILGSWHAFLRQLMGHRRRQS